MVITVYEPGTECLEMAMFGFSGRGTESLGRELLRGTDPFWPPYAACRGRQVGIYVCEFDMGLDPPGQMGGAAFAQDFKVTPISEAVLSEYFG